MFWLGLITLSFSLAISTMTKTETKVEKAFKTKFYKSFQDDILKEEGKINQIYYWKSLTITVLI